MVCPGVALSDDNLIRWHPHAISLGMTPLPTTACQEQFFKFSEIAANLSGYKGQGCPYPGHVFKHDLFLPKFSLTHQSHHLWGAVSGEMHDIWYTNTLHWLFCDISPGRYLNRARPFWPTAVFFRLWLTRLLSRRDKSYGCKEILSSWEEQNHHKSAFM